MEGEGEKEKKELWEEEGRENLKVEKMHSVAAEEVSAIGDS